MSGMKWIKFYTGVLDESDEMEAILERFGFEGFGKYWGLMAMLGKKFSEEGNTIVITDRKLRDSLRFKSRKKLREFLLSTEMKTVFNTVEIDNDFAFDSSILLDLKSRDFKKTRSSREQTAYKNKSKKKNKNNTYKGRLPFTPDELVQIWNEEMTPHNFAYAKMIAGNTHLNNFLEAVKILRTEEMWKELFSEVREMPHLCGDNEKGWRANLIWLINPDNLVKVQNGNYAKGTVPSDVFANIDYGDNHATA